MNQNFRIEWIEIYSKIKKGEDLQDWDWEAISKAPHFKFEWVNKYPEADWSLDYLYTDSKKRNTDYSALTITAEQYFINKELELRDKKRIEYMAAYKIQQWWKYITISPHHAIGRKFINRKYDELFE